MKKNWAIDLGTTNSAIAYSTNTKAEAISLKSNKKSLPTMVFLKGEALVAAENRKKGTYKLEDRKIFEEWKIKGMVDEMIANKPFNGSTDLITTPINLSATIIRKLADFAEESKSEKIENLSVSIPANFKEPARINTIAAIRKALPNIKEIKLIHEPTAAAASILVEHNINQIIDKQIMVYDMGGGTLDVSIVRFTQDDDAISIDVIGTNGINIAGKAFDNAILDDFFYKEISDKLGIKKSQIKNDKSLVNTLLFLAEKAKIELANEEDDIKVSLDFFFEKRDYTLVIGIKYEDFLASIKKMLDQANSKLKEVLKKAKLDKSDINFVVPAGSSTNAPWVRNSINNFFGKNIIKQIVDPETAIAIGGAILSGINHNGGIYKFKGNELEINEVAPTYIGFAISGFANDWLIKKGAQLPVRVSESYRLPLASRKFPVIKVMSSDLPWITWDKPEVIAIIDPSSKIKDPIPNSSIEIELLYDDKMSVTVTVIYKNQRFNFTPVSNRTKKAKLDAEHKSMINYFLSIAERIDLSGIDSTKLNEEVMLLFETYGYDTSIYKDAHQSDMEMKKLAVALDAFRDTNKRKVK